MHANDAPTIAERYLGLTAATNILLVDPEGPRESRPLPRHSARVTRWAWNGQSPEESKTKQFGAVACLVKPDTSDLTTIRSLSVWLCSQADLVVIAAVDGIAPVSGWTMAWVEQMASLGFARAFDFDPTIVTPHALLFREFGGDLARYATGYERELESEMAKNAELLSSLDSSDPRGQLAVARYQAMVDRDRAIGLLASQESLRGELDYVRGWLKLEHDNNLRYIKHVERLEAGKRYRIASALLWPFAATKRVIRKLGRMAK